MANIYTLKIFKKKMRVLIKNILNTFIFNIYYKKIMNIIISLYFDTYIYKKQNSKKHSSKKTEYK